MAAGVRVREEKKAAPAMLQVLPVSSHLLLSPIKSSLSCQEGRRPKHKVRLVRRIRQDNFLIADGKVVVTERTLKEAVGDGGGEPVRMCEGGDGAWSSFPTATEPSSSDNDFYR